MLDPTSFKNISDKSLPTIGGNTKESSVFKLILTILLRSELARFCPEKYSSYLLNLEGAPADLNIIYTKYL